MKEIINILIKKGEELFAQPYEIIKFTGNEDADNLLNDLENYPHPFVLACLMDRQIKADRAWLIPFKFANEIRGFEFSKLLDLTYGEIKGIFDRKNLHRFNNTMAEIFYFGIQRIDQKYDSDVSSIWERKPKSATLVRRFLQFKGAGIKIASMAANILARDFKIPLVDRLYIDISPDVQVRRVFTRLGLIDEGATNDELIYCARELNPEYPGVFDLSAWEIGRECCRPKNPICKECYLRKFCPKIGVR